MVFVGDSAGGGFDAWSVDLDVIAGVARNVQRLASSTSSLHRIRGSPGKFVVAAEIEGYHLWKPPLDLNIGRAKGPLEAIPHSGGQQLMPSSSPTVECWHMCRTRRRRRKWRFPGGSSGGQVTTLLEAAQEAAVYRWTADGNDIVFWSGTPIRFSLFNVRTRHESVLMSHPTQNIHGVELSPFG